MSNIKHPTKTLETINAAIVPIKYHFEAYQNKQVIRDVSANIGSFKVSNITLIRSNLNLLSSLNSSSFVRI